MAGDAEIRVAIVSDNSDLNAGLNESQSKLASFGRTIGRAAVVAGAAAAVGLAAIGRASVEAASEAQQSLGAVETVFGRFARRVKETSSGAALEFGLSANDYRESAALIGSLLKNQGTAMDQLAPKSERLVGLASDLAATYGGTTAEAIDAVTSAYKGEFDTIERLGISLKQSTVNAEALKVANVESTTEFNELTLAQQTQARQQATTNLLFRQGADAQGAFAREANTLAGQQQRMGAQWTDLKVKIGNALLPAITNVYEAINNDLFPVLNDLADQYLPAVRRALNEWTRDFDVEATFARIGEAIRGIDWGDVSAGASDLRASFSQLGSGLKDVSLEGINDGFRVFNTVIEFAADHVDTLAKVLPYLVAGFAALKAAQLVNQTVGRDSIAGFIIQAYQTRQLTQATTALSGALKTANTTGGTFAGTVQTTGTRLGGLKLAASAAAGTAGLGLLTASAATSNEKASTLMSVLGSAAMGGAAGAAFGPWGIAIGGVVGGLTGLIGKIGGTEDAMEEAEAPVVDYAATFDQLTGAITGSTRAQVYQQAVQSGAISQAKNLGVSLRDVVNATLGMPGAMQRVNAAIEDNKSLTIAWTDSLGGHYSATVDNQKQVREYTRTIENQGGQIDSVRKKQIELASEKGLLGFIREQSAAWRGASAAKRREILATQDLSDAYGKLPRKVLTKLEATGVVPTTRGIAKVRAQYDLTPKQVKTLIEVTGTDTTIGKVKRVGAAMKDTGNTRIDGGPYKDSVRNATDEAEGIARSGAEGVGRALKDGTTAGMSGLGGILSGAMSSAVNEALAAGRRAADSHSPSRETMKLGQDLGAGLVMGLDSSQRELARAGGRATQAALGGMAAGGRAARLSGPQGAVGRPATASVGPAAPVQLRPAQTPVRVFLDGQEIADGLTMRAHRIGAASSSVRRRP